MPHTKGFRQEDEFDHKNTEAVADLVGAYGASQTPIHNVHKPVNKIREKGEVKMNA